MCNLASIFADSNTTALFFELFCLKFCVGTRIETLILMGIIKRFYLIYSFNKITTGIV